jgi:hypothetical protein
MPTSLIYYLRINADDASAEQSDDHGTDGDIS